ncbi:MAG: hypothetical protein F4X74_10610 [Acidimicrobiia bacterium]|nr:hypothetical protein [Acidimicrobiia bacterium]
MTTNRNFRLAIAVLVLGVFALAAVAGWDLFLRPAEVAVVTQPAPPTTAGLTPATTRLDAADLTTTTTTPPTTTVPATTTMPTTTMPTVCEAGYHAHDGHADDGACHPDHPDEADEVAALDESTQVALDETVWWRPGLGDEAFALVDPDQVGADHALMMGEDRKWGSYRYYLFYHGMVDGAAAEAELFWDVGETFRRVHQEATLWVYYPYRYDLEWAEYPSSMRVTATFPLGDELTVLFLRDGEYWAGEWDGVEWPTGPPIRPTTPFAAPRYPATAQALGRDCPPVEDLWEPGADVTDPCTTAAVAAVLDYAETGPTAHRMAAIRDGHVLDGVFAFQDNIGDPFYALYFAEDGRTRTLIEVVSIRWAGAFPQSSMIEVEYRLGWPPAEMTDKLRQSVAANHEGLVEYLHGFGAGAEPTITLQQALAVVETGGLEPYLRNVLVVRSSDGTWRLSYRSFCTQWIITASWSPVMANRALCPPDPTPWFPDSAFFDTDIYPPNHLGYYNDPRALGDDSEAAWAYDRGGIDQHRLAGEYLGVPPS